MSTTGRNRSILAGLVAEAPVTETPSPPMAAARPPERLNTRFTGLSKVTSGDFREKTLLLVDPARCRMWTGHNRRYELLSEQSCADLVESLRSQGEQEFPAIVRRPPADSDFDYEVICGARRHWSVSFLRTVEHRDIKFLIEVRDLDDEAAFRLADVENRSRKDICDYERALDYRNAVEVYYGGKARLMAQRMEVQESWLSRFLELAKLPVQVVEAYGDIEHLKERHARALKPLIADDKTRPLVMAEAKRLAAEQARRKRAGEPVLEGAKVLESLKRAAVSPEKKASRTAAAEVIRSPAGVRLFTLATKGPKKAVLELALVSEATDADFHAAFETVLARLRQSH
jgi:ParB family chromosome partitioning protein